MKKSLTAIILFGLLCAAAPASQWDAAQRNDVLTQAEHALDTYVFPKKIPAVRAAIEHHRAGLVRITDPNAFADSASRVIYGAAHDEHLRLTFSAQALPAALKPPLQDKARLLHAEEFGDFGYIDSARLDGNIGYLRIDWFSPASESAMMLDAAMTLLSQTDAMIIDLRYNDGGSPKSVDYLIGYFVPAHTELTGFLMRVNGKMISRLQYAAAVPNLLAYVRKPVYVLTSGYTFSAAEQFAYDLQSLHRATIIGQTTGGGANIGGPMRLSDHFMLFVPHGTARSPYTGTNWDGAGVQPDVRVKAPAALLQAYTDALKAANSKPNDERRQALNKPVDALRKTFSLPWRP